MKKSIEFMKMVKEIKIKQKYAFKEELNKTNSSQNFAHYLEKPTKTQKTYGQQVEEQERIW